MDERSQDFVEVFRTFLQDVVHQQHQRPAELTPIGQRVQDHLGADVRGLSVLTESLPRHRLVDADVALDVLAGGGELLGISGGQHRHHEALPQLLDHPHAQFAPAAPEFSLAATGPGTERRIVSFGLRLFRFEDRPVALLQRGPQDQHGRREATLEVLADDVELARRLLVELRRLMVEHSVLRGQLLSFESTEWGHEAAGVTFLERPAVPAGSIVLADGVLDAITEHVLGITRRAAALRARGQHLKRGVLLHGPPGTGKTLTVRHLVGAADGVTSVLLTGSSIRFITVATEIARVMQPAIVVLEDIDLVAEDRDMHGGPQPLLFAVLDALDGLAGDADVAFVMTTNRVEVLESALAQRPGRVDLAVEIPRPGLEERRRLFTSYAEGLPFSAEAIGAAAEQATGVTGSFAKELVRRSVLRAVAADREPGDADLAAALEELLAASALLTRQMLGGAAGHEPPGAD